MQSKPAYGEPTKVTAVDGEIVLDGPDGVGLSMTPEAAEETARRLSQAVEAVKRQQGTRRQGPAND